jgi:hypothetical protein
MLKAKSVKLISRFGLLSGICMFFAYPISYLAFGDTDRGQGVAMLIFLIALTIVILSFIVLIFDKFFE